MPLFCDLFTKLFCIGFCERITIKVEIKKEFLIWWNIFYLPSSLICTGSNYISRPLKFPKNSCGS